MKTMIKLSIAALCLVSSLAFADGLQTSGGVKPRPDARFGSNSTEVYVMLKSVNAEKSFNNIHYYQALVDAKQSSVQKIQMPEQMLKPEVLEALQRSYEQNNWAPVRLK